MDQRIVSEGPYPFNCICLTAEDIARFQMEWGTEQFEQRFNIGYCP